MSMMQYPWDLEERVEDAIVAHLKSLVGVICDIRPARLIEEERFPMVVVQCGESNNENDNAQFNGQRRMNVTVAIVTEAINNSDQLTTAELLQTARETHRALKSQVIGALASTALQDELNATQTAGLTFSMAHMTNQTRDAGDGKLVTEQVLDVIAGVKEID